MAKAGQMLDLRLLHILHLLHSDLLAVQSAGEHSPLRAAPQPHEVGDRLERDLPILGCEEKKEEDL